MFIEALRELHQHIKLLKFKKKYRKKNAHNFTRINNIFDLNKAEIGNYTYGNLNIRTFNNKDEFLKIGNFCSIANNVLFLLSGEHNYKNLSTYPFKTKFNHVTSEAICKGKIIVGDDVWIGENCIILSGVTIGQGSIVGAGSIVTKDIPPYSVYGKDKIIKTRFSNEIVEKLLKIDYSKIDKDFIEKNMECFYTEINSENIDSILSKLK